ncbi:MAG: aa3-type cytochrome c oxidase subunit IV [Sphingomicrobium sp.]
MAADPQPSNDSNINAHARDYDGFITILKWAVLVIAIVAAVVLYLISN